MASSSIRGTCRLLAGIVMVCLIALTADVVLAGEPSAAEKETARQLMDVGNLQFRQGHYEQALESYRGADDIMKVTSTGLGLGKTLVQLGRLIEARSKLLEVTRIPVAPNESEVLTRAREQATRLQQDLADRIPALRVLVVGLAKGAPVTLYLDGLEVPRERLALPRRVNPGTHAIRAACPGYVDVDLEITVAEGKTRTVELELTPTGATPPVAPAADGGGLSPLVWVGLGIAGVGATVGAITGGLSLAAANDAKDQCVDGTCPLDAEPDADRSLALAHTSTVSFVVAGLGAGLGIVGLVLSGSEDPSDGASEPVTEVEALLGPGVIGLRMRF
ncbi:MAG: hypothetical protein JRI68_07425 [Deltaproteobacteria bacterium]|nr:hypothetical protein [Deltaproteobacteria bacterium]